MELYEDPFQCVLSMMHNEVLFSGEKFIDVAPTTLFPPISPVSIESAFHLDNEQTSVNQKSNSTESLSSKKERMLENGQIKIFTQAIDSYYNSTIVSDIEVSPPTVPLNCQYSISPENQAQGIPEKHATKVQKDCQKNKIWNSDAGKKILAVYFSPMNMKSEFLSKETALDGFESFALQEAVFALQEIVTSAKPSEEYLNEVRANLYADPLPVELVRSCEKSRAFRKLTLHDKIVLLQNAFMDLNAMKNVTTYDHTIDGWHFGDKICSRKRIYTKNPNLYKKAVYIMDSFPVRFKSDFNVVALLFLIIIFNADLPKLKFKNTIKSKQYVYIYLLQRYLISCVQPTCEALEYFYQLMTTVEEIQVLKRATVEDFDSMRTDGSHWLNNRVVRLIELESILG